MRQRRPYWPRHLLPVAAKVAVRKAPLSADLVVQELYQATMTHVLLTAVLSRTSSSTLAPIAAYCSMGVSWVGLDNNTACSDVISRSLAMI